ncbi:MAG: SPOR domain-containing protein [Pseudomonadales bacterium]
MNSNAYTKHLLSPVLALLFCLSGNSFAADKPDYWQHAYKPSQETHVIDLPADMFAVQLIAVSTRKQVEAFVELHNLWDMTAVKVSKAGKPLYVLIPGVYKSRVDAESAVASLPVSVQQLKPWIRPLGGLQQAMRDAKKTSYAVSD